MPTPAAIIDMAASLMNDTAQTVYTDAACLPYLNMALNELQEIYQQNNVPITNDVSAVITLPAGTTSLAIGGVAPALPSDLIEIRNLWESGTGLENYTPVVKREFLPLYDSSIILNQFGIYAWVEQQLKLPSATAIIDLKVDYIKSIFATPILIASIANDLPVVNALSFLGYKTAALCAMFIGENPTRAQLLDSLAIAALDRTLGISTKGKQSIVTRRRPFRTGFKLRGYR